MKILFFVCLCVLFASSVGAHGWHHHGYYRYGGYYGPPDDWWRDKPLADLHGQALANEALRLRLRHQPPVIVHKERQPLQKPLESPQPSESSLSFSRDLEDACITEMLRADEDWWAMVADGKDPSRLSPAGGRCYRRFWEDKKKRTVYEMVPVPPPLSGKESKPEADSSPKTVY